MGQTGLTDAETINKIFAMMKLQSPGFLGGENPDDARRMWLAHLRNVPAERVERAANLVPDRCPDRRPTLGKFKQILAELNVAHPERRTVPRERRIEHTWDERTRAWKATMSAYGNRCSGLFAKISGNSQYDGDFDYLSVAMNVPMPESSSMAAHKAAWKILKQRFDEAWHAG